MFWLFVRRSLLRRKTRLGLTELSLALAFFLFALLQGLNMAFQYAATGEAADRLMVMNRIGAFSQGLPRAYADSIAQLQTVREVTPIVSLAAYYQDPSKPVEAFGVDPRTVFGLYPEWHSAPQQIQAWIAKRNGAIVGSKTAKRHGWKIGDIVPLTSGRLASRDGSPLWPIEVVGFYEDIRTGLTDINILVNIGYIYEGRVGEGADTADFFIAGVNAGTLPAQAGRAIDERFANSAAETESQTEKQFGMSNLKRLGDLDLFVGYIVAAVFFALLIITASTMYQSVQDRTAEYAALQALGYRTSRIAGLIWAEALLMCGIGAALGIGAAAAMFPRFEPFIGIKVLPPRTVVEGVIVVLALASVIAIAPLWTVHRTQIAQALSRRGAA